MPGEVWRIEKMKRYAISMSEAMRNLLAIDKRFLVVARNDRDQKNDSTFSRAWVFL